MPGIGQVILQLWETGDGVGVAVSFYNITFSPSSTQLEEINSVCPELATIVAIGLQKPYAKLESNANLVLV
jgi:hypothetical protein